mgnify:CR=1 FL=1
MTKVATDERGHDEYCNSGIGLECDCFKAIQERLEYLRGEIKAERISYGEIAELQSLAKYIDKNDVELLEWAGVKEKI